MTDANKDPSGSMIEPVKAPRLFVCGACGKEADDKMDFADASCMLNAVEVIPSSVKRNEQGRIVSATAWKPLTEVQMSVSIAGETK